MVEAQLADEPERDDLAQPEAVTAVGLPRHLGTLHGRRVRHLLHQLAAPVEEHVLGFPGASAPYWEFRGFRPSLALVVPTKGPVLFRRIDDRSAWVRFGWGRSDNWLPVEDPRPSGPSTSPDGTASRARTWPRPSGSSPTTWWPPISTPRDGHCYKTVRAAAPPKLTPLRHAFAYSRHLCPHPDPTAPSPAPSPAPVLPDYDGRLHRQPRARPARAAPTTDAGIPTGCPSRSATPTRWSSW